MGDPAGSSRGLLAKINFKCFGVGPTRQSGARAAPFGSCCWASGKVATLFPRPGPISQHRCVSWAQLFSLACRHIHLRPLPASVVLHWLVRSGILRKDMLAVCVWRHIWVLELPLVMAGRGQVGCVAQLDYLLGFLNFPTPYLTPSLPRRNHESLSSITAILGWLDC